LSGEQGQNSHPDFAAAFDRFDDARIVCVGGASYGTAEFQHAPAAITRRLMEWPAFDVVSIKADRPVSAVIGHGMRALSREDGASASFARLSPECAAMTDSMLRGIARRT